MLDRDNAEQISTDYGGTLRRLSGKAQDPPSIEGEPASRLASSILVRDHRRHLEGPDTRQVNDQDP
jgi:hypothetical protein